MIDVNNIPDDKNKGECFSITSFCNSPQKINALKKTIDNIKQYGLPIFLHAHYPLEDDIQRMVNFYFYSSDNPILNRYNIFWHNIPKYKLEIKTFDVTYTTLKGWYESIGILENYNRIHMINYDTNLTPEIFNLSRKYGQSIFLQNQDTTRKFLLLTYFCLNREDFKYFRENIRLVNYLKFKPDDKFLPIPEEYIPTFLINKNFFIIPNTEFNQDVLIANDVAEDARFNWDKTLDMGPAKIFIGEYKDLTRILFFDVKEPIQISIVINERLLIGKATETELFNLGIPFKHIISLQVKINDIFIPDDLIKKFFHLDCKIYDNSET